MDKTAAVQATWVDLTDPNREDLTKLARQYHLHPLQIEECFAKGQLPQVEVEQEYVFLLLYFPRFITTENRIVASHVNVFLGKDYLITIHDDTMTSLSDLHAAYQADTSDSQKTPAHILYAIIDSLLSDINNMVHMVTEDLDQIELEVFDNNDSDASQIGQLRQKIVRLRRITAPLKDLLEDLSANLGSFADESLIRHYQNNQKIIKKLWDAIGESQETIEIYKDADFTTSTERTNDILAILTLVFTLTIPATVLGTFYGMNIIMPGSVNHGPWTFLGPYTTLILIIFGSVIPVILMMWYFRRKKWF